MKNFVRLFSLLLLPYVFAAQNTHHGSINYQPNKKIEFSHAFSELGAELGMSSDIIMVPVQERVSKSGMVHKKYKHTYQGIDIFKSFATLHCKNNIVTRITGNLIPHIDIDLSTPQKHSKQHTSLPIKYVQAKYKIKNEKLHQELAERVIIDKSFPNYSGHYTLADRWIVTSEKIFTKYEVLVSVPESKVIFSQSLIRQGNADGIGKTFYYGDKPIKTDSLAPNKYILRDRSRGNGITTRSMKTGSLTLFEDEDNIWDDEDANHIVAIDAHHCTAAFYDFMFENFDYSGIDGNGQSMDPIVYALGEENFVNAFWDGQYSYFGSGDCHTGPLTSYSIVGHEFFHGITQANADLIYSGESGAINESYSDIFGKALEFANITVDNNWLLDPTILLSNYGFIIRSFENPNDYNQPKKYKGYLWEDNAGVHTNSGVLNYWFYLLMEGGTGENEETPYSLEKQNMMDILQVLFLAQTSYLNPSSGYEDMFVLSMLACEELFGEDSQQYKNMKEAWKAVGLPHAPSGKKLDLGFASSFVFETSCLLDDFHTINLTITNYGTESVPAGTTFSLTEDFNDYEKEITLTKALEPGDSYDITIDDLIYYDSFDWDVFELLLEFDDDVPINNIIYVFTENYLPIENEIELDYVTKEQSRCFDNASNLAIFISNATCSLINDGTLMEIEIKSNNNLLKKINYTINEDILPGQLHKILLKDELPEGFLEITAQLIGEEDLSNNVTYFFNTHLTQAETPLQLTFDDISEVEENFNTLGNFEVVNYNNESYLWASTISGFNDFLPCFDLHKNFPSVPNQFNTSSISACIDLSTESNYKLSFDMLQFRSNALNEFEDEDLSKLSSILKVEMIDNNKKTSYFINDLPVGQLTNHEFEIPEQFKGEIRLSIFNFSGLNRFDEDFLISSDAILLDNFKIFKTSSSENESLISNDFKIFPNPTTQYLNISPTIISKDTQISIFSPDGSLKYSLFPNSSEMDISFLKPGFYIISIIKDSNIQTSSFIKM